MRKNLAGYRSISDLVWVVEPWGEARKSRDESLELRIQVELLSRAMQLGRSEHIRGSTWWGIMQYAGKLLRRENSDVEMCQANCSPLCTSLLVRPIG